MCPYQIHKICLDCPKLYPGIHLEPKSVPYKLSFIPDTVCRDEYINYYRVTTSLAPNLLLTSKQKFCFGLATPGQGKTELLF